MQSKVGVVWKVGGVSTLSTTSLPHKTPLDARSIHNISQVVSKQAQIVSAMLSRLIYPILLCLLLAVVYGDWCMDHSDCSPMFSCVEGVCQCRFGPWSNAECLQKSSMSIFRFAPLNQIPLKKFSAIKKFYGDR